MTEDQLYNLALEQDHLDPLKASKNRFVVPDKTIYLDGNSLGLLPKCTIETMSNVVTHEWGQNAINSWNERWYNSSIQIGNKLAPILGASDGEVIISDSTSINMYKLVSAVLGLSNRSKILTDELNFPSNIYLLQGIVRQNNQTYELDILKSSDGLYIEENAIQEALATQSYNLLVLSHVNFKSAQKFDMQKINRMAKLYGTKVIWDLSHSAGSVDIGLNLSEAEFAVGCTYKYLNGGPGSPAFLYVAKHQQETLESPIWGWFGSSNAFEFGTTYKPYSDIRKFLVGTPPILSQSTLNTSLDVFLETGLKRIWTKRNQLLQYFWLCFDELLKDRPFQLATKRELNGQGSHVLIEHHESYRITKALTDPQVMDQAIIPDFRSPKYIRVGLAPLYNTYLDIFNFMMQLAQIEKDQIYLKYSSERTGVT